MMTTPVLVVVTVPWSQFRLAVTQELLDSAAEKEDDACCTQSFVLTPCLGGVSADLKARLISLVGVA
jgi:hypothetical protein